MAGENWTFWLNMTNFALGIVTLLAVVVVAGAVSWDLFFMWLHKVRTGDVADVRASTCSVLWRRSGPRGGRILTVFRCLDWADDGGWWRKSRSIRKEHV